MGKGGNDTLKCLTLVVRRNVLDNMFADVRFGKQLSRKEKEEEVNNRKHSGPSPRFIPVIAIK